MKGSTIYLFHFSKKKRREKDVNLKKKREREERKESRLIRTSIHTEKLIR